MDAELVVVSFGAFCQGMLGLENLFANLNGFSEVSHFSQGSRKQARFKLTALMPGRNCCAPRVSVIRQRW